MFISVFPEHPFREICLPHFVDQKKKETGLSISYKKVRFRCEFVIDLDGEFL